jgi:catechol 2,3-dioxygenase-like lactoylglutathione lyase family enzyme
MTSGISHFAIKVRDLVAAERFYCDVLGLRVLRRWADAAGTGLRSVWLRTGDAAETFLALEALSPAESGTRDSGDGLDRTDANPNNEHPGHYLLALRIRRDQRASCEARLAGAGITVSHRTAFTMYFTDPEGNRLGLSHYPDPSDPVEPPCPSDPRHPSTGVDSD